jgi:hypothetical protein
MAASDGRHGLAPLDMTLVLDVLDGDPLLTPGEAAAELGISMAALRRRKYPAVRVGDRWRRYRTSVIAAAKASRRTGDPE